MKPTHRYRIVSFLASGLLLLAGILQAQTVTTPLYNAKLTGMLDGNGQTIKSLSSLSFGAVTPTAASAVIHILPNGSPTTASNGIKFGSDVALYRGATGKLYVTGDLVVSGSVSGSNGIVELAGANIFSGSNTFNGAVVISNTATFSFDTAFDVANGAVAGIQANLDLVPGTHVQAYSALLAAIAALNPQSGYVMVGNGSTWVAQGGATARTSLGLGTGDNVSFANLAASGTLAVTGASTLNGKVTAAGAVSDATGLQFGTAGAWYGSGSGIVTDDPVTLKADVVLGDNAADVTQVFGVLKLGNADDLSLTRSGAATGTLTGSLAVTGSLSAGTPVNVASGGTGRTAVAANRILLGNGTNTMDVATLTNTAMTLLDDSTVADMRTTLELGTAATRDTGTGATNVILGNDARLTDSRTPTGSAAGGGSDIEGSYPSSVTIKADAVALGTDTTGSYVLRLTAGTGVGITGTNDVEGAIPIISIGQSVATGASPTFAGLTLTSGLGVTGSYTSTDGNITLTNGDITLTNGDLIVTNGSLSFPSLVVSGTINPAVNDGSALGSVTTSWSDLFLASGATINFANGNAILTHSSGVLNVTTGDLRVTTAGTNSASVVTVGGTQTLTSKTISAGAITASTLTPVVSDGTSVGTALLPFSDLFLATGAVINFANGNAVITHSSGIINVTTGDLRVTTVGTDAASVVTVGGTQTLSGKTLTAARLADGGFLADANGNELLVGDTVASAVNAVSIINSITGAGPVVAAMGDDTNVPLNLRGKGTGHVTLQDAADPTKEMDVDLSGATTATKRTVTSSHTANRTNDIPDADGSFEIRQSPVTVNLTSDNQTVTPGANTVIQLESDDATATNRTFILDTTGAIPGIYVLIGPTSTNLCELQDTGIQLLSGTWTTTSGATNPDSITLLFTGTNFIELGRSNN